MANADLPKAEASPENRIGQLKVQMPIQSNAAFGQVKIRTKKGAKAENDLATSSKQLSSQMKKLTPLERQQYI